MIVECQQGSAAWYRARLGKPTASNFHRIITAEGAPSRQAMGYLYRLVAERLLNQPLDEQLDRVEWAERGRAQEPQAMDYYAYTRQVELEPVGFMLSDDQRYGCSPDRLIKGRNAAVECKAPAPWTQLQYLIEDGPGAKYRPQVQGQLLIGGFECVHFFSWHPQMPEIEIITKPDKRFQTQLRGALNAFCDALDRTFERAQELGAEVIVDKLTTPAERAYAGDLEDE